MTIKRTNKTTQNNKDAKKPFKSKNKRNNTDFNLNNSEKKHKNFMYQNLTKARCYNCDFSSSNFDFVSFRGSSMKSCRFSFCSFKGSEFIGTNLKESNFNKATFENVVFESAKLVDVDFKDAEFINTIFLSTDLSEAKNLKMDDENIRIYESMPEIEISDLLKEALEKAMTNKYVKQSRVLDTREGKINHLSVMILLENFSEEEIVNGLNQVNEMIDRDFYALSFIISLIKRTNS